MRAGREAAMIDYKVYFLSRAERVEEARDLDAENDTQAIRKAVELFDGRPMELWQRARVVRKFGISGHQ
jgi:hypothetical protein